MLGLSSPHVWEYQTMRQLTPCDVLRSHRPFDQDKSSDLAKALIDNQYDERRVFFKRQSLWRLGFWSWRKLEPKPHGLLTRVVLMALQRLSI